MVSFESVIFKEKTEFDFSVFHNHTSFQQAEFHQKALLTVSNLLIKLVSKTLQLKTMHILLTHNSEIMLIFHIVNHFLCIFRTHSFGELQTSAI